MRYEYIPLLFDFGNLIELNRLSREGFKVVSVQPSNDKEHPHYALLERELP